MISVIVPAMNEGEGIQAFYDEMMKVMPGLDKDYEIIFIDDGSTDNTLEILKSFVQKNHHIRVFSFKRNRGKADALAYGFYQVKGDVVITMDADLQDKPSQIEKFIAKHKEGADVVCGWRKHRKDKSRMVVISKFFNYLIGVLFGLHLHDIDCGFKLFTTEAAKSLHIYGGLYRFIPVLLYENGYVVDEVVVEHDVRHFGHSKYGFSKVWKNLPDLFTMIFLVKYSKRPLHFFGILGGLLILIGVVILLSLWIYQLQGHAIGRRPALIFGMLLVISGLQTFFTGFLADLMINISHTTGSAKNEEAHFPLKYASGPAKA
ncbi:MAG: glycosyltransferase family 2 protein [Candidatus Levyibacteriota bacterium]